MRLDIVDESLDGLSAELWSFIVLSDHASVTVRLTSYHKQERPSRRHKFKDTRAWLGLTERWRRNGQALIERPEPPTFIKERALKEVRDRTAFT